MTPQEKQDLKARFFGQHHGAHFTHPCFSGTAANWGCYLDSMETPTFWKVHDTFNKWYSLDLAKLILRPLPDITDEEVLEMFLFAGIFGVDVIRDSDKIGVVGRGGNCAVIWIKTSPKPIGRFLEAWNNVQDKEPLEVFEYMIVDWLRSKNFALPFCGKDPIAENWAILQETTNQPTGTNNQQ